MQANKLINPSKGACGKMNKSQIPAEKDRNPNIAPKSLNPNNEKHTDANAANQKDKIMRAAAITSDSTSNIKTLQMDFF
jgi:hypothetical protein